MPEETEPIPVRTPAVIKAPRFPGVVQARDSVHDLYDLCVAELYMHALSCVRAFGDFHLALSGGSTPEPLYRRLMCDPAVRELPWKRTHLWIVDERCVPLDHEQSNYRMIHETIVSHSDIPTEQVHPIQATEPNADELYEQEIRRVLEWREKGHDRFDYVLLGLGGDGHTASLFPHSPALDAPEGRLVVKNAGPKVTPPPRITMTYQMLNASRCIGVLITGAKKRDIVKTLESRQGTARDYPIKGIKPFGGELRWYLDREACGE